MKKRKYFKEGRNNEFQNEGERKESGTVVRGHKRRSGSEVFTRTT